MKILDFFHGGYYMKNRFVNMYGGLGAEPPGKFGQNQWKLGVRVTPRFHHGGGLVVFENTVSETLYADFLILLLMLLDIGWNIDDIFPKKR